MSFHHEPNTWPLTLDTAIERVLSGMTDADKQLVRATPEDRLILFHHGPAAGIRHEFGLWRGNLQLLESCGERHPDDASMVIVRAVWKRLQEKAD